jgi:tRNA A37 N6-isopentenylltransferase MiaA
MAKLQVVGVVGCTGTGKTTLCERLSSEAAGEIVSGDDFFLSSERCPALDLSALWKEGHMPEAFAQKTSDTNVPESIDWVGFEGAVLKAIQRGREEGKELVLVESFL